MYLYIINTCIYRYICKYICTYIRTYLPTYLTTYLHTCITAYPQTYLIRIHTYSIPTSYLNHTYIIPMCQGAYVHTRTCRTCARTHVNTYIRTYVHTYLHKYIHIHIRRRILTHIYIYT